MRKAEKIIEIIIEQSSDWESGRPGDIMKVLNIISLLAEMAVPDENSLEKSKMAALKDVIVALIEGIEGPAHDKDFCRMVESLQSPIKVLLDQKTGEMTTRIALCGAGILQLIVNRNDPKTIAINAVKKIAELNPVGRDSSSEVSMFNVTENMAGPLKIVGQVFNIGVTLIDAFKPTNIAELKNPVKLLQLSRNILDSMAESGQEHDQMNKYISAALLLTNCLLDQVQASKQTPPKKVSIKAIVEMTSNTSRTPLARSCEDSAQNKRGHEGGRGSHREVQAWREREH